eukprot:UC1_evm1s701
MDRLAKKCESDEKKEKLKIKKAMQKNNVEGARIHAENAIRQKNNGINFLRMSARVDAVAQRVQTAVTMRQVTMSMKGVVRNMDKAMASMNLEQMSALMDKFEKVFEDIDVQTKVMDGAMGATSQASMPEGQIDALLDQVADEHGLERHMEIGAQDAVTGAVGNASASQANAEQDELTERLARLRQG